MRLPYGSGMVAEQGLRLVALREQVGALGAAVPARAELERLVSVAEGELDRLRDHWLEARALLAELDPRGIEAQAKALRRARDRALTPAQRSAIDAELSPVTARYEAVHAVWDGLEQLEIDAAVVIAELEGLIIEAVTAARAPKPGLDRSLGTAAQAVRDRLAAIEDARAELGLPAGVPSGPPRERIQ